MKFNGAMILELTQAQILKNPRNHLFLKLKGPNKGEILKNEVFIIFYEQYLMKAVNP